MIEFVYYLFNNGYDYLSYYRRNVLTGGLDTYNSCDLCWYPNYEEKLDQLLNYGNGKRTLTQVTEEEVYKYINTRKMARELLK